MEMNLPPGHRQQWKLLIVTIYGGSPHTVVEEFSTREQADFVWEKINSGGTYTKATKLYEETA